MPDVARAGDDVTFADIGEQHGILVLSVKGAEHHLRLRQTHIVEVTGDERDRCGDPVGRIEGAVADITLRIDPGRRQHGPLRNFHMPGG